MTIIEQMDAPFFSVVIPVYNKGAYIRRTIESVLQQSFTNFELIIINDASTDNSISEINTYKDKRISLFERDTPGPGGYAARNLGIQKAKAKWVALLDADDIWYPEHLEKLFALIRQFPDVNIFGAGWIYRDCAEDKEDRFYSAYHGKGNSFLEIKEYLRNCIKGQQPICSSVACINKKSPLAVNLFPVQKNIRRGGDIYAWLKMLCYHKGMAWSAHVGAIYNLDSTNMVTKTSAASPTIAGRNIYDELSKGLNKAEKKLLTKYLNRILKHEWFIAIKLQKNYFNIRPLLYWKYDIITALKYTLISLLPQRFIKRILFGDEK